MSARRSARPASRGARTIAGSSMTLLVASVLSGCGAEVAGTAATVGAMQASQAEQARARQAKVVDDLAKAQAAAAARTASAVD